MDYDGNDLLCLPASGNRLFLVDVVLHRF